MRYHLLGDGSARSQGRGPDDSHEGTIDLARVFSACLQDVVVYCSDHGGALSGWLLFAWSEEGGMLGRLGKRVLMLGCEERRRHLLRGHCYLRYCLETSSSDLLRIGCYLLLGFDHNWFGDNARQTSRIQMGLTTCREPEVGVLAVLIGKEGC